MTYASTEILTDLLTYITFIFDFGTDHYVDYFDFVEWTSIDFKLPEVTDGYRWLVANGYIVENASYYNYHANPFHKIMATKKAWDWAKENNIDLI